MGWRLRLSDKTVPKFAELPIYCQRQKCSQGNVVSGNIKVYADIRGGSLGRWRHCVKWECGRWKWRFSLHSFTVFRTFYIGLHATRQLSRDATVDDLGDISRSLNWFTSNLSQTLRDKPTAKVTTTNRKSYTSFRLVPCTLDDLEVHLKVISAWVVITSISAILGMLSRRKVSQQ